MRHIFPSYAYGPEPKAHCWWDETCTIPQFSSLAADDTASIAIIGGGFTGLNAAYHLAKAGKDVVVLDANEIGWGASGRNGGFCCLGGGTASDALLDLRFGKQDRLHYRETEKRAVSYVGDLIQTLGLDVDRHSNGETALAHRAKDMNHLLASAEQVEENYGVVPQYTSQNDMAAQGLSGPFFGAMTTPIGFALNPRKYLLGLATAARDAGARIFENADVVKVERTANMWVLDVGNFQVKADKVIVATNGYSSETVPDWLGGRYMPTQSNVIVTRPISDQEQAEQGWTSAQMAFDTRNLLHYFRLLPDGRFLFGMRGGLTASARSDLRSKQAALRDFRKMFPAWSQVDITHNWSGMVSVARSQLPFVGQVPDAENMFAGLSFHGNGVAMGSYVGKLLSQLALNDDAISRPLAMSDPPAQFPFGAARRVIMPAVYAGLAILDF